MTNHLSDRREAARSWAVRVADPGFDDWDLFTAWLEEDPRNADEYDRGCDDGEWMDAVMASGPPPAAAASPPPHARQRQARWAAAAAAAVLAVGVSGWLAFDRQVERIIATGNGERRTVVLDAGTRVVMNGSTALAIGGPRKVRLDRGQAVFEVRHDAEDPFVVTVGDVRLVDEGTIFEVLSSGGELAVGVAQGQVAYRGPGTDVTLRAGQRLSRGAGGGVKVQSAISESVGSWRSGYLSYTDATLGQVAGDLSRNLGRPVVAAGVDAGITFSGILRIDGHPDKVLASAGPLLGVRFVKQGAGWAMKSDPGAR